MSDAVKVPEVLYHYCSVQTFYSIIKNKSIWLSDLSKTNDSEELVWLKKNIKQELLPQIREQIRQKKEEQATPDDNNLLQWEFAESFVNEDDRPVPCWGFCLSEKDDDLGQWRGYGDDAAGISIGFKGDKLSDIIQPNAKKLKTDITLAKPALVLGKVNYGGPKEMDESLNDDIERIAEDKEKLIRKLVNTSESKYAQVKPTGEAARVLVKKMAAMTRFPFYKIGAFESEGEYRIVFSMPHERVSKEAFRYYYWPAGLRFRKFEFNANTLVSHIDIGFVNMKDIIKSITIGPRARVTERDIELFLKLNGVYDESIEIKKSAASYR